MRVCVHVCVVTAVLIKVETVYIDMSGIERTDICSDLLKTSDSYDILNNVAVVRNWTFACRSADFTSRILPFGHQMTITMGTTPANVTLNIYEVQAYGRPYTGQRKSFCSMEICSFKLFLLSF